ncbi:MAG: saccharopine dehydrogenase NADP-binding domain-containing protein [Candidatus Bathyarchaeota archaeon]|nr:MAG: saccharopine dehydrogenase NADP-binding domain-containing protein [Candidatus Bathyarchaeota archaeon]
MARILVLGGGGAQGSAAVMWLAKDPQVSEVVCADLNIERARQLTGNLEGDKVHPQRIDAWKPDQVFEASKGVDVVINMVASWVGERSPTLNVMDAALKNGAHYVDVATALREEEDEMLKLSSTWDDAGLTAIFDLGKTPGITNILARYAADKLDHVDEIRVKTCLDVMSKKEFLVMWSPIAAIPGWSSAGLVYENGEYKKFPPFSGEETYTFPGDPQGPCKGYLADHEEIWTLPRFIKNVCYVEFKHYSHRLQTFKTLGELFGSEEPIDVRGVKVAPLDVLIKVIPPPAELPEKIDAGIIDNAYSCCVVEVKGEKAGKERQYTLSCPTSLGEVDGILPGTQPESILVGTPPAVAAAMLVQGEIKTRGVMPPECLNPEPFLANLTAKGIRIYERVERRLG